VSRYNYSEKEILSLMNFTGFSKQEAIDYLHDLVKMDNEMRYKEEQESKVLEQLFKPMR